MGVLEELADCRSIFDIAAVWYSDCEDRLGDLRFHKIRSALAEKALLADFGRFRDKFQEMCGAEISGAKLAELREGKVPEGLVSLRQCYTEFWQRLHDGGFPTYIASWAMLKALDESLTPDKASGFCETYQDREVKPLNTNVERGWPSVFFKITSSFPSTLTPARATEEKVWSYLEYLAIIPKEEMDPALEIRLDGPLWDDMLGTHISLAAMSPEVEPDYFTVEDPPDNAGSVNVFWVAAHEPKEYRERITNGLKLVDDAGAIVVILPELMSSEKLEREVEERLQADPCRSLRLIVLGSCHIDAQDRKANQCSILDRRGDVIWRQNKREPFQFPPEDKHRANQREWIVTEGSKQILMMTSHGGIAVQVCKDFLPESMRQLLCKLGCRWFLVTGHDSTLARSVW